MTNSSKLGSVDLHKVKKVVTASTNEKKVKKVTTSSLNETSSLTSTVKKVKKVESSSVKKVDPVATTKKVKSISEKSSVESTSEEVQKNDSKPSVDPTPISEPLLSEELAESLGGIADAVIDQKTTRAIREAREHRKRHRDDEPTEEVVQVVKKLSKKQQKRVAQIQKRKERELHRDEYMEVIAANVISQTQRELLTSSRAMNHQQTLRQLLKQLIRKERAGIALTEEERNVLYTKSREAGEEGWDEEEYQTLFGVNSSAVYVPPPPTTTAGVVDATADDDKEDEENEVDDTPLFSLDDMFASSAPTKSVSSAPKKPKNKKKKVDESSMKNETTVDKPIVDAKITAVEPSISKPVVVEYIPKPPTAEELLAEAAAAAKKQTEEEEARKAAAPKPGFGKNLLQQFMVIKQKKSLSTSEDLSTILARETERREREMSTISEMNAGKVYHPEATVMPTDLSGKIQVNASNSRSAYSGPPIPPRQTFHVKRPADVVSSRMNLPVCQMEQEIVDTVNSNDVVLLCGETGSGKSTQVPQFLYEYGYGAKGMIGIAQPRRVAVTSTADRVSYEMGENPNTPGQPAPANGRLVGYQIRYDGSTVGSNTRLKYLTDGILLREVTADILLRSYSVIILDEAHERNVNTDILLGMLSRTIILRRQISAAEKLRWESMTEEEKEDFLPPMEPLRLIIMSATIRVEDFQTPVLFPVPPPVVMVEARQFPVVSHFAKRTELKNYLKETHRKVCQIHRKLPAGGILVFLTGKREILYMCNKLQRTLGGGKYAKRDLLKSKHNVDDDDAQDETNDVNVDETGLEEYRQYDTLGDEQAEIDSDEEVIDTDDEINSDSDPDDDSDLEVDVESEIPVPEEEVAMEIVEEKSEPISDEQQTEDEIRARMLRELLGTSNIEEKTSTTETEPVAETTETEKTASSEDPLRCIVSGEDAPALKPLILPLFAMMTPDQQARVFATVPPGYRLIVVATNVAETSITIPGMTYVVDSGRCKEKVVSTASGAGISKYEIQWVTKASADQRLGRAGRTGPGHCYRLYSANFYHEHMRQYSPPEITQTPLEDVVLQMKALGIKEIESFPFPTAPPKISIQQAMRLLRYLGAIVEAAPEKVDFLKADLVELGSSEMKESTQGDLTSLGRHMSKFPLHPRFAKMILIGVRASIGWEVSERVRLLSYVLTMVASIAERTVFLLDEQRGASTDNSFDPDMPKEQKKTENDEDEDEDEDEKETEDLEEEDEVLKKLRRGENKLFFHSSGDIMARLRATGAFMYTAHAVLKAEEAARNDDSSDDDSDMELSEEPVSFTRRQLQRLSRDESILELCSANFLHEPTLQRVLDLRSQLQTICEGLLPQIEEMDLGVESEILRESNLLGPVLVPPSIKEDAALRQILLSGYGDSIARKAPIGMVKEGSRRDRLTAYFSCNPAITEPIYIHPQSNLYCSDPTASLPSYIAYGSLVRNTRGDKLYMSGLTVINPEWISSVLTDCTLLQWSAPLEHPAPKYDRREDAIVAYAVPKFGIGQWALPAATRPLVELVPTQPTAKVSGPMGYRTCDAVYRWFARLLLEGSMDIPLGGTLSATLCQDRPSTITQCVPHQKVGALLRALITANVSTRSALYDRLSKSPDFLRNELEAMLRLDARKPFRQAWAELAKRVAAKNKA